MEFNRRAFMLAGAGALASPAGLAADPPPDRQMRIVVPFTAGGVGDSVARLVADDLSTRMNQRVIVENKPGAGGSIGTELVARAPADGMTLLLASPGFTVNPSLQTGLKWDPIKDFAPVAMLATIPNVIVVNPAQPYRTLADLIAEARKPGANITFGSAGIGSSPHLAGELLNARAGVKLVHVPYKGQSDAVADLVTGRLTFMAITTALATPLIESGKLRALAVTSAKRIRVLPQVPTVMEAGISDYEIDGWLALLAPVQTDAARVAQLNKAIREALAEPRIQAALTTLNCEVTTGSPADLGRYVQTDRDKWAAIIKNINLKKD